MKRFSVLLTIFLSFGTLGVSARAQEVLDIVHVSKKPANDKDITRDALTQAAIEDVSLENIKLLIGAAKAERNKAVIQNKILKNSNKYILSIKSSNSERVGNEVQMAVELKISLKNLRTLLLEEGLLYQLEGPPKVLPLVAISDRVNSRQYGWWYQQKDKDYSFVAEIAEAFNKSLKDELSKIGFYGMSPLSSNFSGSVPEPYRIGNLQRADALFLGEFFKSSIVVRGEVLLRPKLNSDNIYLVDVRLEALHSSNGRVLGEVVRTFETAPGQFRAVAAKKFQEVGERIAADMSVQLSDAWKKGTFGSSLLRLTVRGSLAPRELDQFKKTILLQVRDIKSLRERFLQAGSTTYEIDSSTNTQQLAIAIRSAKLAPFNVEVNDVRPEALSIYVKN